MTMLNILLVNKDTNEADAEILRHLIYQLADKEGLDTFLTAFAKLCLSGTKSVYNEVDKALLARVFAHTYDLVSEERLNFVLAEYR